MMSWGDYLYLETYFAVIGGVYGAVGDGYGDGCCGSCGGGGGVFFGGGKAILPCSAYCC